MQFLLAAHNKREMTISLLEHKSFKHICSHLNSFYNTRMLGIFYNIKYPTLLISSNSAFSATSIVRAKTVKIHVLD